MNNSIHFNCYSHNKQYKQKKQIEYCGYSIPAVDIIKDPVGSLNRRMNSQQRRLFNQLLFLSSRFEVVYVTQQWLADKSGYTREHVNRLMVEFQEMGLLTWENRGYKNSNIYHVSPFFNDLFVRAKLRKLFSAFQWLPLAILSAAFTGNITQDNSFIYKNIPTTIVNTDHVESTTYRYQKKEIKRVKSNVMERVEHLLGLNEQEIARLEVYPDTVLAKAEESLQKAVGVSSPKAYFFVACKNIHAKNTSSNTQRFNKTYKPETPVTDNTVRKTEMWKGHAEVKSPFIPDAQRIAAIVKDLMEPNAFMDYVKRLTPLVDQREIADRLVFPTGCYCDRLKERWNWQHECTHSEDCLGF